MKILFFGDIVGKPGRQAIKKILPDLKKSEKFDLVVANGENLAHGKGINKTSIKEVLDAGIDFITSGNHIFSKKEAIEILEDKSWPVIRPANFSSKAPGDGFRIINIGARKVLIINLTGRVFMHRQYDDPFECVDELLEDYGFVSSKPAELPVDVILVDWHAEATSEKMALGWYLDGRVSAVIGTHTHISTADCRILPKGTAYISDIGMVGPRDSVLGINKDEAIKGFLTQISQKFDIATGPVEANFLVLDIDEKTGLAQDIVKRQEIIEID